MTDKTSRKINIPTQHRLLAPSHRCPASCPAIHTTPELSGHLTLFSTHQPTASGPATHQTSQPDPHKASPNPPTWAWVPNEPSRVMASRERFTRVYLGTARPSAGRMGSVSLRQHLPQYCGETLVLPLLVRDSQFGCIYTAYIECHTPLYTLYGVSNALLYTI